MNKFLPLSSIALILFLSVSFLFLPINQAKEVNADEYIKIGSGRNPAMAVDSQGNAHITYDNSGVKYVKYSQAGFSLPVSLGSGGNSRVAIDNQDNAHVVWQNGDNIFYNKVINGSPVYSGGRAVTEGARDDQWKTRIEKPRIAVNQTNNQVYIYFQDVVTDSADYFSFDGDVEPPFFEVGQRIQVESTAGGKPRPGNLHVENNGTLHFSHTFYANPTGIYYQKFSSAGSRLQRTKLSGYASDFSDMAVTNNKIYIVGQRAWATGIYYYSSALGQVACCVDELFNSQDYVEGYIYIPNMKVYVDPHIARVSDPDNLDTDVEIAKDGTVYVSFAGAGDDIYMYKEKIDDDWQVVGWCDVDRGEDECRAYYYRSAYYFNVSPSGLVSDLYKVTPSRPQESQQGAKYTNPAMAPANNQGVFIVWEDDYGGSDNIWLRALDGAKIGGSSPEPKSGDLNSDGKVDIIDLGILLSNWGSTTKPPADLNQDGYVDIIDLGIMLSNWS